MAQPFVSIIIPAYNEEMRISRTLDTVVRYVRSKGYSSEILVTDDGSEDNTAMLVEASAREYEEVRLIRLDHRGKGSAVKCGMLEAEGQYRFLADADLSMNIEHLERFLPPRLNDYDIALGSREAPGARRFDEPITRHIMGRVFNWMVRILAVKGLTDTQCGFKCFEAWAAEILFPLQRSQGFGFDVEILFLAQRLGMRTKEVPIDWYYNEGSKVRPLKDSFLMMNDLLSVRWNSIMNRYGSLSPESLVSRPTGSGCVRIPDNVDGSD